MRIQQESSYLQTKRISPGTKLSGILILNCSASGTVRNKFVIKSPNLGYFVIAVQAKTLASLVHSQFNQYHCHFYNYNFYIFISSLDFPIKSKCLPEMVTWPSYRNLKLMYKLDFTTVGRHLNTSLELLFLMNRNFPDFIFSSDFKYSYIFIPYISKLQSGS